MEFESKTKREIQDLIDVLQPIADEGNQEALELIETLLLDNEYIQIVGKKWARRI